MAILILELSQGGRAPLQYIKVDHLPFTIGRGYDNDLILADDGLCARHLLLTQDESGQPVAVNRSSVNGSRINGQPLTNQPQPVTLPAQIELGQYQLRLLDPAMTLPPAQSRTPEHRLWQWGQRWPLAAISLLLLLLLELASSMTDLDFGRSWQNWLLSGVAVLLLPLAVATLSGFINRLLHHQWHYALHLSLAAGAILLLAAGHLLLPSIDYLFSSSSAASYSYKLWVLLVVTLFGGWLLRQLAGGRSRSGYGWAFAVSLPLLSLATLYEHSNGDNFQPQPALNNSLVWPDLRLAATEPLSSFISNSEQQLQQQLQQELERLAEQDEQKPQHEESGATASPGKPAAGQ